MRKPIKVVYIVGYGHSGSTILDIILGNQAKILSTGELVNFNPLAPAPNKFCACGAAVRFCTFWQQVAERFKHMSSFTNPSVLTRLQSRFDNRYSIACWHRLMRSDALRQSDYGRYLDSLCNLFKAISRSSQCDVIVDSSKSPSRAFAMTRLWPEIDLKIIHLVRDSRAVGWSMLKRRRRILGRPLSRTEEMMAFIKAMTGWTLINRQAGWLGQNVAEHRYLRIRYEDLFEDQKRFFDRIEMLIQEPLEGPHHAVAAGKQLQIGHLVAGNVLRMQKNVTVRFDSEWRQKLPVGYQRFARVILWGRPLIYK